MDKTTVDLDGRGSTMTLVSREGTIERYAFNIERGSKKGVFFQIDILIDVAMRTMVAVRPGESKGGHLSSREAPITISGIYLDTEEPTLTEEGARLPDAFIETTDLSKMVPYVWKNSGIWARKLDIYQK